MKRLIQSVSAIVMLAAIVAASSASWFSIYQAKAPKRIKSS